MLCATSDLAPFFRRPCGRKAKGYFYHRQQSGRARCSRGRLPVGKEKTPWPWRARLYWYSLSLSLSIYIYIYGMTTTPLLPLSPSLAESTPCSFTTATTTRARVLLALSSSRQKGEVRRQGKGCCFALPYSWGWYAHPFPRQRWWRVEQLLNKLSPAKGFFLFQIKKIKKSWYFIYTLTNYFFQLYI